MLDKLIVEELEANPVAGVDRVGLDRGGRVGADVAAQVRLVEDVGEGRHVAVCVPAHVRILAALLLPVDVQDVEDVVGVGRRQEGGPEDENGLHDDG